jgi:hypothetical protein
VAVLDCLRERRPPFSPEAVVAEYAELLKSYRITKIQGDRYAGEWPREQFRKQGIIHDPSASPKSDLFRDLLPLVNSQCVRLPNNRRLVSQLVGLERRTARSGRDSIDHAPGGHDDLANAVAGSLLLALAKKPRIRVGTIDFASTGKVTWHGEREPLRIRTIHVTEQEALRQKAEGTW